MTLIDELNKHKETMAVLRGTEEQGSHEFIFLGHHLLGFQTAIDIVKEHKCTWKIDIVKEHSDWVSTDEQLPYAEEMLTNHYDPKEFYEIILKTGELLITSFTHLKNDGNNEILFMDCTITLTDGEWKLLDDGCDVYEVDEVAYWKPILPPSEG